MSFQRKQIRITGYHFVAVQKLAIDEQKYYFSKRAVLGNEKNAKPNMKRGLWQHLDEPCLTVTSHLAKK